ncbi:Triosephosphate isomerase [bacterium HR26]|nr:Triosephosphate isomerase [bacterium HR26]
MSGVNRVPLIAGNWKMHTTYEEALRLAEAYRERLTTLDGVECALIPPFPWIVPIAERLQGSPLALGAQNCATIDVGALTGEVSARMLAPFCRYVIVGHSERRHKLGESDEMVAAKLQAALRNGLDPILCVGELLGERDQGMAEQVVERQLRSALDTLEAAQLRRLVIAYEPVWAIGTGRPATPADAQAMAAHIRRWIGERFGSSLAETVRIQYGGSVNAGNAAGFLQLPDIDGALVGGASLDVQQFCEIVRLARELGRATSSTLATDS